MHSHIAIQEMSVARLSLTSENFHILLEGQRKHFLYVIPSYLLSKTKLKRISETNNTQSYNYHLKKLGIIHKQISDKHF